MLVLYRRHLRTCTHKARGRRHRHCNCPLWVQGRLRGEYLKRSLDVRSWEAGQNIIRQWEAEGKPKPMLSVTDAAEAFMRDAAARHTAYGTLKNLRLVVDAFKGFCDTKGVKALSAVSVELIREFREGWNYSPVTSQKKLERLRSFFTFCVDSEWIERNPAKAVKLSVTQSPPTVPFTEDEVNKIVSACDQLPDNWGRIGSAEQKVLAARMRAFVLTLRYSGLRIGDATMLERDRLDGNRLRLYTAKTGTPVYVPLPQFVADELRACPNKTLEFFFCTGKASAHTTTSKWRARFAKLLKIAEVEGHPHMMRDTFAVRLLEKGVSLETISTLLGHASIRVTEKHYAPWVKSRQESLDRAVQQAWSESPVIP